MTVAAADARTCVVTCRLRHGVALPVEFPAPLDGILAGAARRRRLGADHYLPAETPDRTHLETDPHGSHIPTVAAYRARFRTVALPLVRTPHSTGCGKRWVWAATCATWPDTAVEDVRWHHKRPFKLAAAEHASQFIPANPDVGLTKAWRLPTVVTVTGQLTWTVLGDPNGIRDLLTDVTQIGKGKARGEGLVTEWTVDDDGPADWTRVQWLPDTRIARPYPTRLAAWLNLNNPDLTLVDAYRPPYWRPPLHNGHRQLQEVIAPWTTRP